jgi:hypothetical protein
VVVVGGDGERRRDISFMDERVEEISVSLALFVPPSDEPIRKKNATKVVLIKFLSVFAQLFLFHINFIQSLLLPPAINHHHNFLPSL